MTDFLTKIIEMSLQGSVLILIIAFIRIVGRKIPRRYICLLWYLVGIRLVLPFSFGFEFQEQPANPVQEVIEYAANKVIYPRGEPKKFNVGGGLVSARPRLQIELEYTDWLNIIWVLVLSAMLIYMIAGYFVTKYRVREAVLYKDNIYYCENVRTPFLFGYLCPRIYISYHMKEDQIPYVVEHERMHLKRRDHFSKLAGFLLLAVYWFNPVIWLGYAAFCNDLEYACDEGVIRKLGQEHKKEYSRTLLGFSIERCMELPPLGKCCFGEAHVKSRVQHVLGYKALKPVAVVVLGALCILFMAVGFAGQYNVEALMKVPLKDYEIYFGMTSSELEAALENVPYEKTQDERKIYYNLKGQFETEFGPCQHIEFEMYKYEDRLTDLNGNKMDAGLWYAMFGYEEGKQVHKDYMLKRLERYYGNLDGGETGIGIALSQENPDMFYDSYYNKKWDMDTIPDMEDTLLAWYALRGIDWPYIKSEDSKFMRITLVGEEGVATRVDLIPDYLMIYLRLKNAE